MQRKAKNGVDYKYQRMDGNAIRRPRETGSRSGKWRVITANIQEDGT